MQGEKHTKRKRKIVLFKDKKSAIAFFLKLVLGVSILLYLFNKFDYERILAELKYISIPLYLLVVMGHFVIMAVKSYRWCALCQAMNVKVPYGQAFYAYSAAFSIGIFSPGQIGDFSKVLLVDVSGEARRKTLVAAFEDRIWDVMGLVFICFVSLFVMVFILRVEDAVLSTYFLAALVVVVLSAVLFKPALRFLKKRYQRYVSYAFTAWRGSLALTAATIAVQLGRWALLAAAFNYELIWSALSATIGTFVALIPISVAGIGTREAALVYLFGLKNMDAKSAIAFSLVMFSAYVIGAVFGAILLLFKKTPVGDASMKDLL